ncbi:MAG: ABC transporter permease subunit [Propionibacteriales bacterium]|nr:ABC transporter permease subunit [Propionibacteriales bacterium]
MTSTSTIPKKRSRPGRRWDASTWVGATFLISVLLFVTMSPLLPGYDPSGQDVSRALLGPFESDPEGNLHILGTDQLGRDLASRLALAGTYALRIALGATLIASVLGTVLGILAGYLGGVVERGVTTLADVQLSIPRVLLLVAAMALLPRDAGVITVTLGLSSWMPYARVARTQTRKLRRMDYVSASRLSGASAPRIMSRSLAPNVVRSIAIVAAIDVGEMVMLEATVSFLGLGVRPPATSWGLLVFEAQSYVSTAPHMIILPGLLIFLLVAGINFGSRRWTGELDD